MIKRFNVTLKDEFGFTRKKKKKGKKNDEKLYTTIQRVRVFVRLSFFFPEKVAWFQKENSWVGGWVGGKNR